MFVPARFCIEHRLLADRVARSFQRREEICARYNSAAYPLLVCYGTRGLQRLLVVHCDRNIHQVAAECTGHEGQADAFKDMPAAGVLAGDSANVARFDTDDLCACFSLLKHLRITRNAATTDDNADELVVPSAYQLEDLTSHIEIAAPVVRVTLSGQKVPGSQTRSFVRAIIRLIAFPVSMPPAAGTISTSAPKARMVTSLSSENLPDETMQARYPHAVLHIAGHNCAFPLQIDTGALSSVSCRIMISGMFPMSSIGPTRKLSKRNLRLSN